MTNWRLKSSTSLRRIASYFFKDNRYCFRQYGVGTVVEGWLGRSTTIPHCTHRCMPHHHSTRASFLPFVSALSLIKCCGLLFLADLPVGMAWRCLFLDACLVVVVAGFSDVLRAGSFFLPITLKRIGFYGMWQYSPMHCLVDPRGCLFPPSRVGCMAQARTGGATLDGVWSGTLLNEYAICAPDAVFLVPLPVAGKRGTRQKAAQ